MELIYIREGVNAQMKFEQLKNTLFNNWYIKHYFTFSRGTVSKMYSESLAWNA